MKKYFTLISMMVVILFLSISTTFADFDPNGFNVIFKNDTDQIIYVGFVWVDHMFRDKYPNPFPMAGGEVKPGESLDLNNKYVPGVYIFEVRSPDKGVRQHMLQIDESTEVITISFYSFCVKFKETQPTPKEEPKAEPKSSPSQDC